MIAVINSWKERMSYYAFDWIKIIQSWLLNFSLLIVYFLGIGISRLLVGFFAKNLLVSFRIKKSQESYWTPAKGYNDSPESSFHNQV